jgi:hypothetical protein
LNLAFNWKEKKLLGIKPVKLNAPHPKFYPRGPTFSGTIYSVQHLLKDIPKENMIVTEGPDAASPEEIQAFYDRISQEATANRRKLKLDMSNLFGSHKSYGLLPHKLNKKLPFSYERVFGHTKQKLQS